MTDAEGVGRLPLALRVPMEPEGTPRCSHMTFRRSSKQGSVVHRLDLKRTPRTLQRSGEEQRAYDPASMRRRTAGSQGQDAEQLQRQAEALRAAQDPASRRRAPSRPDPRALDEAPAGKLLTGWEDRRLAEGLAEAADRDERQRLEIQRLKRRLQNLNDQYEAEAAAREAAQATVQTQTRRPAGQRPAAQIDKSRHALMDQILQANLELQKRITSIRPPAE